MIIKRNLSNFTRILYNAGNKTPKGSPRETPSSANKFKPAETPKAASKKVENKQEPVEVFRNDQYNCPEYYGYNRFSFFELIEKMADKRLPQKSNQNIY